MKLSNTISNNLALTVRKDYKLTIIKRHVEKAIILSSKITFSTFTLIVLNLIF